MEKKEEFGSSVWREIGSLLHDTWENHTKLTRGKGWETDTCRGK